MNQKVKKCQPKYGCLVKLLKQISALPDFCWEILKSWLISNLSSDWWQTLKQQNIFKYFQDKISTANNYHVKAPKYNNICPTLAGKFQ